MPKHRLLTAAAAVAVLAAFTAPALAQAPATAPVAPAAQPAPAPYTPLVASGNIATTLRQSAEFTTFVKALDAVNLSGLLQNQPNITVFAPTNAAFAALPAGKLDSLMADKPALQKLLLHHLINAPVPSSKIKGARGGWPTGAQDKVVLDGGEEGVLKADNAKIIQSDVHASNGTIHVVDQVLMAGSVPETLPEPAPAAEEPTPPAPPTKATPHKKKK